MIPQNGTTASLCDGHSSKFWLGSGRSARISII